MRLLIIGGDQRNRILAALERARGNAVQLIGHGETPLAEAEPSNRVVLPFPCAEADGLAPAPLSPEALPMEAVCRLILPRATVYATKPGPVLRTYMQKEGCTHIDFTENEAFTLRNAVPSAEGAIFALMQRSPVCIDGQSCLIVGYGRLGRALALRLRGLCARVTVAARSEAQRAMAEGDGCRAIPPTEMGEGEHLFLLNTVPVPVVGREALGSLKKGGFALDLASPPYGVDMVLAESLGINAWREPGLPGRYAPETAAYAMLMAIEEKDGA